MWFCVSRFHHTVSEKNTACMSAVGILYLMHEVLQGFVQCQQGTQNIVRSPWPPLFSLSSVYLGIPRSLRDALMMEWHGFNGHSEGNFSLTTSNYSLFVFLFFFKVKELSFLATLSNMVLATVCYKVISKRRWCEKFPSSIEKRCVQGGPITTAVLPTSFLWCELDGLGGAVILWTRDNQKCS